MVKGIVVIVKTWKWREGRSRRFSSIPSISRTNTVFYAVCIILIFIYSILRSSAVPTLFRCCRLASSTILKFCAWIGCHTWHWPMQKQQCGRLLGVFCILLNAMTMSMQSVHQVWNRSLCTLGQDRRAQTWFNNDRHEVNFQSVGFDCAPTCESRWAIFLVVHSAEGLSQHLNTSFHRIGESFAIRRVGFCELSEIVSLPHALIRGGISTGQLEYKTSVLERSAWEYVLASLTRPSTFLAAIV